MTKTQTYAVAALIAAALTAQAGTPSKPLTSTEKELLPVKGSFGVDVSNGYTYKGVRLDSTSSTQTYLNLSLPFEVHAYGIDSASVDVSTWQFTNPNAVLNDWVRSEVVVGVGLTRGNFTLTPSYHSNTSPNSEKGSSQAVDLTLDYMGLLGLDPHVSVYKGLAGTPGQGSGRGTFYQVGVAPTVGKAYKTTFVLPVNVNYGTDGFYAANQKCSYTTVGLETSTEIAKNVSLNTSLTRFFTDKKVNAEKPNFWIASAGVELAF